MNQPVQVTTRYPLLEAVLQQKHLPLLGIYKYKDVALILGATVRTIQQWCRDGKLQRRDLPGRGKFLSEDLEAFLQGSLEPTDGNLQGT